MSWPGRSSRGERLKGKEALPTPLSAVKCRLDAAGLHVPERIDGAGRRCGGKPFSRGHLYKILSNPIYIGRLSHKEKTYDAQHPAILEQATWDSAQAQLASYAHRRACRQLASAHLLMGRIQDDRGHAMTPTHAQKGSRRYRYYVSQAVLQGKPERGSIARVPAPEIEALVISAMRSATPTNPELSDGDLILHHLNRVTLPRAGSRSRSTAKMKLRSTCRGPNSRRSAVARSWCRRAASLTCAR